jgi:ATP synthase protein I
MSRSGRFLDSPYPKHYGPRGFLGRQDLSGFARLFAVSEAGPLMAEDTRRTGGNGGPPDEEAVLSARLQRLRERLAHRKVSGRDDEPQSGPRSDPSALARGFRLSTELVAGVLVGAFIGWALDKWLGISPWGMIVFLLLGFAAGVINVMRAAGISGGPGQGS